jgi:hypothetical protein
MLVSALIKRTQQLGDFAAILEKGDPISGAILLIGVVRGKNSYIFERHTSISGESAWEQILPNDKTSEDAVAQYAARRIKNDPDLWLIELDVADDERLNGILAHFA